ncbi:MAG TPA: hypothetical protein VHD90_26835 [Phototrophicaceae bacterium]|nr:hypothetical protein [Phototrophicaceae bacterium]
MSSNEMDSALSRAFALIEDGKLDEARAILEPILATDRNNADAWWVYAHAVATPEEGRNALQNVLRIAPDYPGAAELMAMAQNEQTKETARTAAAPAKPTIAPISAGQPAASAPPTLPETHPSDLEEPDLEPEAMPIRQTAVPPARGLPIAPILAVLVIIILVVLVIASQLGGGGAPPTPTQAAILVSPSAPILAATEAVTEAPPTVTALMVETTPTVSASEQVVSVPTLASTAVVTSSPQTTSDFTALRSALSQFSIAQNGITQAPTSVGNTVLVSVCTVPGRAMRSLLPQVMNALAKQVGTLNPGVQGIGVRMINCDQNSPLLTVAVDTGSAKSYAQGKLTDAQYAALWKPQ